MSVRSILAALRPATPRPKARVAGRRAGFRPRLEPLDDRCLPSTNVVTEWNQVVLDTVKADRLAGVYFTRTAAIVHAAIYDAVNDIDRSYTPFFADVQAPRGASLEAAAAQAAHDTLTALFPAHRTTFDATLAADLAGIPPGRARLGVAVGQEVAQQILAWRSTDGSGAVVPYTPGTGPGVWQPTPPAFARAASPQWGQVTPIRAADTDGNPDTAADPAWTPFLVTPAHPSYISGHSGVSGASAAVLAAFFGTDAISFTFSSDSLPGVTRSFTSFSATAQECSDSRVYAGIHWRFDVQTGQAIGNEVGDYVTTHFLLPREVPSAFESGEGPRAAASTGGVTLHMRPAV